jgi:hypothetical protein
LAEGSAYKQTHLIVGHDCNAAERMFAEKITYKRSMKNINK